jgi:nitrate reductase gamma subunit
MNNSFFWQIVAWFFWAIALALLIVKYKYTSNARQSHNREIKHKWLGWYDQLKIQGTSSQRFRKFMQVSNQINNGIWLSIILGFLCLLMYRYAHYLG